MRTITLAIALLMAGYGIAQTQETHRIHLAATTISNDRLTAPEAVTDAALNSCTVGEVRFLVAQFTEIPSPAQRVALEQKGVAFLGYLPHFAYLLRLPVQLEVTQLNARALLFLQPEHKLSAQLAAGSIPAYAQHRDGWRINAYPYDGIGIKSLAELLRAEALPVAGVHPEAVELIVAPGELRRLAAHPAVALVDLIPPPPTPEGLRGRTLGRVNQLSSGPTVGLDGTGVHLAIADDGAVNHIDFTGRLTDWTTQDLGSHGDMTAGLAVGAGNLNPLGMGMAPAADLFLFSIDQYPHIAQAAAHYEEHRIVITSTSYGEGCGGWYSPSARSLDEQVIVTPPLFHTFSAGNSSAGICSIYGDAVGPNGERYGNITGGRKAAKHSLAVANLYFDDRLRLSSSRGPTYDGRIKPDISAHGQGNLATGPNQTYAPGGGTSAAAPTLAGTVALLYQAYRDGADLQDPPSALIKAAILNSAKDLGRPGPDYDYGWGRIHAGRALEVLTGQQFQNGTINHGETTTHQVTVPDGVSEVRVMVYWPDPAGLPNAARALVNDLDLSFLTPEGAVYHPWVLSAAPQLDSLTRPARRGLDRRNNMEQVSLTHPAPGTYELNIQGYLVPEGPQPYHLVYTFIYDDLALTYPAGGEGFVPGETETIRWDAPGSTGTFSLEYSIDSLTSWLPIADGIDGGQRHFDWQIPPLDGQRAFVRVRRHVQSARSDSAFSILSLPIFDFFYETDTSALIYWSPVPGATAYDVYRLGDRFMEIIGHTSGNSLSFPIDTWEEAWLSVRARTADGGAGRRSPAQKYLHLPCEAQISLTFQFDQYPAEIQWEIQDLYGAVLASGGPYEAQPGHSTLQVPLCLPAGCYALLVRDQYGDGLCCEHGAGSYQVTDAAGNVLLSGGVFGEMDIQNFCAGPTNAPLNLQLISLTDATCNGAPDGSARVAGSGGTGNYTYTWSDGQAGPIAAGLATGDYHVTITDGQEIATLSLAILQPPPLSAEVLTTDGSCFDGATSTATALATGGTPPYHHLWSNGLTAAGIDTLSPGNYALTVTDANGCAATHAFSIGSSGSLALTITQSNVGCYGGTDGAVTVQAAGGAAPYIFQWADGVTKSDRSGLAAGDYGVTVTDSTGCAATALITLTEPPLLTLSLTDGPQAGSIDLSVAGGVSPYTFDWSDGSTAEDPTGLPPGDYSVTVTDDNGCTRSGQWTLTDGAPDYCNTSGASTSFEWIEEVALAGQVHLSGNDGGYGDYTTVTFELTAGDTIPAALTPGQVISGFPENWRLWIDLNQDGDFTDDGELLLAANQQTSTVTGSFSLPTETTPGITRLRISMRYGSPPPPCGGLGYGEAEDYQVQILPAPGDDDPNDPPGDDPPPSVSYCESGGQSSLFEWIESVQLGDLLKESGNDGGYADFTDLSAEATIGQSLPVELTPGFQGNYFGETWRIWADFNQDGDFVDDGELLFSSTQSNTVLSDDLSIPATALPGPTRLRITLKWGALAEPCESYNWGETEDYTLFVRPAPDAENILAMTTPAWVQRPATPVESTVMFPNPTSGVATLRLQSEKDDPLQVELIDVHGRLLWQEWMTPAEGPNEWSLPTAELSPGTYLVRLTGEARQEVLRLVVR